MPEASRRHLAPTMFPCGNGNYAVMPGLVRVKPTAMILNLIILDDMKIRSSRLLACFLSLVSVGFALASDSLATNSYFQITKSFPVSEATWSIARPVRVKRITRR
jgi:hypothetical protein